MADSLAAALIGDAPGERYAWEGRGAYNTGGDQSNRREVGRLQIEHYRHSHNVVDAVGLKKRVLSIGSQDKVIIATAHHRHLHCAGPPVRSSRIERTAVSPTIIRADGGFGAVEVRVGRDELLVIQIARIVG